MAKTPTTKCEPQWPIPLNIGKPPAQPVQVKTRGTGAATKALMHNKSD